MNKLLAYAKAQKLFKARGLKQDKPSMHMVFTGNPGTAKTTVARLLAQILKDNEILPEGSLYEVGRSNLVGRYVGHTAPLVRTAFERASGGVLFIDEAYSLVDDRSGSYGDEAINTIVQEMENHREDTVVIFAGYPKEMKEFLERNPGLSSRIAFHVNFEDYTADELCTITAHIAAEKGAELGVGVEDKLHGIFGVAAKRADFGNGRYARNLVESARRKQALRLLDMPEDGVTGTALATLLPEDFEECAICAEPAQKRIGFAV